MSDLEKDKKPHESYVFLSTILKLLEKMNAVILGQSTAEYPRVSKSDKEINDRMLLKIFRLDWWICYETSETKDYPYSLKISIVPDVKNTMICADIYKNNLNNLSIKINHSGKSNHYSSNIRNLLRTLDRFTRYHIDWEILTPHIDGMLISEEGLMARIMFKKPTDTPLTGKMLQLILLRDPLKAGSLQRMHEISVPVPGSMVPILSVPALYDGSSEDHRLMQPEKLNEQIVVPKNTEKSSQCEPNFRDIYQYNYPGDGASKVCSDAVVKYLIKTAENKIAKLKLIPEKSK
jgi:hypothetical protein